MRWVDQGSETDLLKPSNRTTRPIGGFFRAGWAFKKEQPTMPFTDDNSIEHLAHRMIDRTLPKSEWTHEGHFAAALWLLRYRPELTAPDEIRALIMQYNEATNTPNTDTGGYHHTITLASMRAAATCLIGSEDDASLHRVLANLMTSRLGRSDWLLDYWERETLFSVAARKAWVEPDRAPLPFG